MASFEKIAEEIYILKIPFGPVWTGVVLVRGDVTCLIDSGATAQDVDAYILPALKQMDLDLHDIDWLGNTHCHGDHIGGHRRLWELGKVPVAAFALAAPKVSDPVPYAIRIRTRFPAYSPAPQSQLQGVPVTKVLEDGEMLGDRLRLIHTPGHDDDCVCWYDEKTKTLITGDSLQANGTICQGIGFYQDLPGYYASLRRLQQMDIETILCGHDYDGIGWCIQGKEQVKKALCKCLEYLEAYHRFILERVRNGTADSAVIARELIDTLGCGQPDKLFMALYTVEQHRLQGQKEGIYE